MFLRRMLRRFVVERVISRRHTNPSKFIILVFIGIILLGALLLMLPVSSRSGEWTPFITAVFTSTSATCVTGLIVEDTYTYWSGFGQAVILALIQCGGLGFMSLATMFSFLLRRKIGLRERLVITQSLNINDISGVVRLMRHILYGTFLAEGIGALILSIRFSGMFGWRDGIIKGVFHSVSAFCNAGFDLMGQTRAFAGLTDFVGDPIINITIMALIIVGGLGFFVWEDIYRCRNFKNLAVHTKLVIIITAFLIVSGTLLFLLFEYKNPATIAEMPWWQKLLAAMFQSVTTRTAGFNTINQGAITVPSKMLSMMLMFIGGSPGSTAGGIKTVTFGILVLTAISVMSRKNDVNAFGRRIPTRAILNAIAVALTALFLLMVGVFVMVFFQNVPLVDVMYDAVSALATVGLSAGVTPQLHPVSLVVEMCLMFFGRIGILSMSIGLAMRGRSPAKMRYPEGKVLIG